MEQKTVKRRFWNEDLGWYEEREVATGKYKFTEEGKVAVVSEYVLGGRPAQEIVEKYHLSSRQVLFSWMDKYVNEREIVSLPENEGDMAKKTSEERMQELEAENKRLRKALELEKLRSEAYSTMIDLAEKPSTSRCGLFGYSRQTYYKWENKEFSDNAIELLLIEKVREYREANPGLGCAKLYLIVKKSFEETGSMPGRDAFIELLRRNGLMVRLKHRRHYRTTDSGHHYHKSQSDTEYSPFKTQ